MHNTPKIPGHLTIGRFFRTTLIWAIIALFFIVSGFPHLRLTIPRDNGAEVMLYLGPDGLKRVSRYEFSNRPPLIVLLPLNIFQKAGYGTDVQR